MEYILHILILVAVYVTLAVSLNLLSGYAGQVSLAHGAVYGLGAYTAGLLAVHMGTPFGVNLLAAVLFCGLMGALMGLPSLRVRGDYLVIATFSVQVITVSVLNNWRALTEGTRGLYGIPQPGFFGILPSSKMAFLLAATGVAACAFMLTRLIVRSPFGRVLVAIREDELFALSFGKNVAAHKIIVFSLSGGMAGAAGALIAHYVTYIDPTGFTVSESILVVTMIIVGGSGGTWGPVIGAFALVALPELLRFVGVPGTAAARVRGMLYGLCLLGFVLWRPQGLLPPFYPRREGTE